MARIANSLATLRSQVDAAYPARAKFNDGWIGDTAHQQRHSDHNPNSAGVVQALDLSHSPDKGFDSYEFAELQRVRRDPRIKYVISNGRIFLGHGSEPWTWQAYTGADSHSHHVHVSVSDDPALYDDPGQWVIRSGPIPAHVPFSRQTNIVATVFGGFADPNRSAYDNHVIDDDEIGVALPARVPAGNMHVRLYHGNRVVDALVMDVGPWNIDDPYWVTSTRPQAETGTDRRGRKTNHAGIDLTPAAARALGIDGKGVVDWEFITPGGKPMTTPTTTPTVSPHLSIGLEDLEKALQAAEKFLPLVSPFLPPQLKSFTAAIPVVEGVVHGINELKTNTNGPSGAAAIVANQLRLAASKLEAAFNLPQQPGTPGGTTLPPTVEAGQPQGSQT